MKEIMKSQIFKIASLAVAFVLVALVSFLGGIKVGSHKALFSCRWGENYARNFMGARPPMNLPTFPNPMGRNAKRDDFRNAHGLSGSIISVADNKLVIKDRDGKENTVAVTDKTIIKDRSNDINIGDLNVDDNIVVIGKPNDGGTVDADLIRVFKNLPPNN